MAKLLSTPENPIKNPATPNFTPKLSKFLKRPILAISKFPTFFNILNMFFNSFTNPQQSWLKKLAQSLAQSCKT